MIKYNGIGTINRMSIMSYECYYLGVILVILPSSVNITYTINVVLFQPSSDTWDEQAWILWDYSFSRRNGSDLGIIKLLNLHTHVWEILQ